MGEISDSILKMLQGRSPQEIQRILNRLAREAALDEADRQQAQADQLAGASVDDLQAKLQRMRKSGHPDRLEYDRTFQAYQAKIAEQEQANRPTPQPAGPAYAGPSVQEINQKLNELRAQPAYKIDRGEYNRLVDAKRAALEAGALQPAPAQQPRTLAEELAGLLHEDDE
jgi:hypothetical protein